MIGVEQVYREGLEAILFQDLLGQLPTVGVGIGDLDLKLAAGAAGELVGQGLEVLGQGVEGLGQSGRRGHEALEHHRLAQASEQIAAGLIGVERLLDGAGQVVLGVAQAHLQLPIRADLDLDEVAEAQLFVLVAIAHQDVKIGVDHRGLVLAGGLEGHRLDAIFLPRLLFQFRRLQGVDELNSDQPLACHLVLLEQVTELGHQGGELRMGLGAEVAANQQGLPQLTQIGPGGVGDGIDSALGQVQAQPAQGMQPEVAGREVGDEQPQDPAPGAMVTPIGPVGGPAQPFQGVDVEGQKGAHQRQVVVEVPGVDDATGDGLEARARADQLEHLRRLGAEEPGDGVGPEQEKQTAGRHRPDQGDDLVIGAGGDEESDGDIGPTQQQGGQIGPEHRPPVQGPEQGHRQGQGQGEGQGHRHQGEAAQELAQHQLQGGDRQGKEQLQGAGAAFLAPGAHGQGGDQEDQQHRHPLEQGPGVGDVAGEEGLHPEEDEEGDGQEGPQEDIGRRRGEEGGEFPGGDIQDVGVSAVGVIHGGSPPGAGHRVHGTGFPDPGCGAGG